MDNKYSSSRCALCGIALPRGVRVALFASPDSDETVLGDFCTVSHALAALDTLGGAEQLPDSLFLGVRVDRQDHDEHALAGVMAEIVRRAVRTSMAPDEMAAASSPPPNMLN